MSKLIQLIFAIASLTFVFPIYLLAGNIPPADSQAKIPVPAAKGIEQANQASEKVNEDHKPNLPKPSQAEVFYKGPLSEAGAGPSENDEPKKGTDQNKGKNAISKLTEVQLKLGDKVPEKSKAPEKILAAKEKIEEHIQSKIDGAGQSTDIPNENSKVPEQGQKGLDKAKTARENQGVSKDHRKDLEHRSDVSIKFEGLTIKNEKKAEIEALKQAKKRKFDERIKALRTKLAAKLPPKAKAVQYVGGKPKD